MGFTLTIWQLAQLRGPFNWSAKLISLLQIFYMWRQPVAIKSLLINNYLATFQLHYPLIPLISFNWVMRHNPLMLDYLVLQFHHEACFLLVLFLYCGNNSHFWLPLQPKLLDFMLECLVSLLQFINLWFETSFHAFMSPLLTITAAFLSQLLFKVVALESFTL